MHFTIGKLEFSTDFTLKTSPLIDKFLTYISISIMPDFVSTMRVREFLMEQKLKEIVLFDTLMICGSSKRLSLL